MSWDKHTYTEVPKYYVQLQMAVARRLNLPAGRLVGHHTDAASKHSLLYISALSVVIVIMAICAMPTIYPSKE